MNNNIEIIAERKWGEPPLKKPKALNGVKQLGSVPFGSKCKCPVYVTRTDIYLKHRDFFSPCISLQRAKEHGIIDNWNHKFIYNDNFGGVVLRNEAWLRIPIMLPFSYKGLIPAYGLCFEMERTCGLKEGTLCGFAWFNMFDNLIKLCKPYKPKARKVETVSSLLDLTCDQ